MFDKDQRKKEDNNRKDKDNKAMKDRNMQHEESRHMEQQIPARGGSSAPGRDERNH
jgi:hypothetical protein